MKALEDKLYINLFKGVYNVCSYPVGNAQEYIRTDAFIEKACEFLDGVIYDYIELKHANVDTFMDVDNKRFIEDFRNYMKGK